MPTSLTWKRRPFRRPPFKGAPSCWYASTDGRWRIVPMQWRERRRAMTWERAPYYTRAKVWAWAIYRGGRYLDRTYPLAAAKARAEELANEPQRRGVTI